jgi:hypothetical protein
MQSDDEELEVPRLSPIAEREMDVLTFFGQGRDLLAVGPASLQ